MPVSAATLRELHRIHRQIADLEDRLARGPRQIQAGHVGLQQLEANCEKARKVLTQARVLADEKQLQLKSRETRIADLQTKLNTCGSNREYQALKEQIAADEQANSVLSDEILEILERIDQLTANVKEADAQRDAAREELAKLETRVAGQQGNLQSELERVQGELGQAERNLPADFKEDYRRMVRSRGEDALAVVEGETCSVCYQILSPQTMNELYLERPVFCKSCGAVLYLAEGRIR